MLMTTQRLHAAKFFQPLIATQHSAKVVHAIKLRVAIAEMKVK
jgi:hypothetical protein